MPRSRRRIAGSDPGPDDPLPTQIRAVDAKDDNVRVAKFTIVALPDQPRALPLPDQTPRLAAPAHYATRARPTRSLMSTCQN